MYIGKAWEATEELQKALERLIPQLGPHKILPSLDELRAKMLAIISTPATRIAGILQAPAGQLARVFSAYGKKA